ncbi:O-acyltransferase like protein-like [Planococcus citri]|uniref:O-acyltransferase like protein-like n=1 Tax=Planococcus citri TaxID=170843 RepID=UPI0031F8126F
MLKEGIAFLFTSIAYRWTRMIPTFALMALYAIYMIPYVGDGPLWNYRSMTEVNNCRESWWTTVFFISNFVKPDKSCLIFTWYITADIQLATIGGILLYIFTKNRKVGVFAVVLTFISAITMTFFFTFTKQLPGIVRFYFDQTRDKLNDEGFYYVYIATSTRCGPYLLGFMTAYLLAILRQKKIKFTHTQMYLFSFISILISEAAIFYGSSSYTLNKKYSALENALYSALCSTLAVLKYAIIGLVYFTSGLGIFTKLIEWNVWIPLSRLSYSVFLINIPVLLHHASSQRQPISLINTLNIVFWFIGDPILIYFLGLIFHLFIEAPILNLNTAIRRRLLKCLQDHNSTNQSLCNKSQLSKNKCE